MALDLCHTHYQALFIILSEGLHNYRYTDCKSFLDYIPIKDDQLMFWCFDCKKNYEKDIYE